LESADSSLQILQNKKPPPSEGAQMPVVSLLKKMMPWLITASSALFRRDFKEGMPHC